MKLNCDQCNQTFNINQIKDIQHEAIKGDIERHYIECPSCHHKYTTHYENKAIKELTLEIRKLQQKAPLKIKQKNKLNKLRTKVRFMSETLKAEWE